MKPADTTFGNTRMPCALAASSREPLVPAYRSASAPSTPASISRRLAAGSDGPSPGVEHAATAPAPQASNKLLRFMRTSCYAAAPRTTPDDRSSLHDLADLVLGDRDLLAFGVLVRVHAGLGIELGLAVGRHQLARLGADDVLRARAGRAGDGEGRNCQNETSAHGALLVRMARRCAGTTSVAPAD